MNPQNPFMQAIQGAQKPPMGGSGGNPMMQHAVQSPMPQGPQGPGGAAQAIQQAAGMGGAGTGGPKQPVIENSTVPGQNPGSTDSLIKALSALNSVVTDADDPEEVKMVRQIIVMIQQLIQRDQQKQGSKDSALGQAMQGASQYPPQHLQTGAEAPGGAPNGTPGMM